VNIEKAGRNGYIQNMKPRESAGETFLTWRALWLSHALITVIVITTIDAFLLQRKFNFFTGGFLSVHHLERPIETLVFIGISLISDFGIAGPLVMLVLWLCSRFSFNLKAAIISAFVISVGPVTVVNFFSYRILDYVGDIFDLPLAFEIAGRSLSEMITVASTHLTVPVVLLTGIISIVILIVWKAHGRWKMLLPRPYGFVKVCIYSMSILLISFLLTCIAIGSSEKLEYGLKRKPAARMFAIAGEVLSDIDRDGYGLLRKPKDPDLFNSRIYPYAVEIPDNGIDENGVAGDLNLKDMGTSKEPSAMRSWKSHPNIILIVLETFRADLVGMDYDGKPVTPVLNRLAQQGVSVDKAFAHIGFTAPSRYHMFTGQLNGRSSESLIDDFKANGYEVAYFSAQDVSFGGKLYDIGFDRADISYDARVDPQLRYTTFKSSGSIALPYKVMVEKITNFLSARSSSRPLFLHINLQDTHFPYYHKYIRPLLNNSALPRSEIGPERADELWSTYLNTASNVDFAVGEILSSVNRYLRDPSPGIVVTADHGESLYDDGFLGHGFVLSDVQTQIPLIAVNLPIVIDQPFGHIELRGVLNEMLQKEFTETNRPVLNDSTTEKVFQYLGNIKRPSQIAFRHNRGRTTYDFRTGRIQVSDGSWKLPGELTVAEYSDYRNLVNMWEGMIISRNRN
jgi:glucan phosphoethanolaminetransferase (alkaline phosphatase superfamily)